MYKVEDEIRASVSEISDKLVVMQIVRLMLDEDGNDGIMYAAWGWNSQSPQSLADRMGQTRVNHEAQPHFRFGMLSPEKQVAYAKKTFASLRIPYVESTPEPPLTEKCVYWTSEKFAEFAVDFHRKILNWELKQYIYENLKTAGTELFPGFVGLQRKFDDREEIIYCGAYSAHIRATDPELGKDDAQDFLDMLSMWKSLENREAARSAERIKNRPSLLTDGKPEPVSEQIGTAAAEPKPAAPLDTANYFEYQQWKLTKEAEGQSAGIRDWMIETKKEVK